MFAFALLTGGCGKKEDAKSEEAPAALEREAGFIRIPEGSPLRQALVIAAAERKTITAPLTAPAVVEADPAKVANVLPPLPGRIDQLHVRLGDAVSAGQPLFTLDSADLAQARSDLQHAQAALNLTRKALERTQDLSTHGIAAQKDLDQAQSDYAGAQSDFERASAVFQLLGLSPQSKESPRSLTVRAPVAGRVAALNAVPGTYVNDATATLMTVADIATVWITASVQEKDLAAVAPGEAVQASLQAYPGERFDGKVAFVSDQLDADSRTIKVRSAYANKDARLKPGMFATVQFAGRSHDAITVPTTALIQNDARTLVFVETKPWTFATREVVVGVRSGEDSEILKGLDAGERLVVRQAVLLNVQ